MKRKTIIILVVVAIAAAVGIYFIYRPSFSIITIDSIARSVTYEFKGQQYTHVYGSTAMGVSDGKYSVNVEDLVGTSPGVQLTLVRGSKILKQENRWF